MTFKLVEEYTNVDYAEAREFIQEYSYEAIDDLKSSPLEEYQTWFKDTSAYIYQCNLDALEVAVKDFYIEAIDCGKINRPKTMITSELTTYLESNADLLDKDINELINNCPAHLKHELTLVLDKIDDPLNEELLTESINTNLRKFLISLLDLCKDDWKTTLNVSSVNDIVVHHINKDRTANSMTDLALMADHYHRRMHGKCTKDNWDPSALTDYPHILVSNLLSCVAKTLIDQNQQDELSIDNN